MRYYTSRHAGFTMFELLIAITITAGLLLGGRLLLERLADADQRMTRSTAAHDAMANADVQLRRIVLQAQRPSIGSSFTGGPRSVHFKSWCDVAAGWEESCDVTLTLDQQFTVAAPPMPTFVARDAMTGAEFRFLSDARDGGHWQRVWQSDVALPLAVGVVTSTDTTIYRIGERG